MAAWTFAKLYPSKVANSLSNIANDSANQGCEHGREQTEFFDSEDEEEDEEDEDDKTAPASGDMEKSKKSPAAEKKKRQER